MVTLLDQYGNPIKKELLKREEAVPTVSSVRSIIPSIDIAGIDPVRMAAIMREADQGEPQAYLEMAEQIEEKDTHYMSILNTRRRTVAEMDITVAAASESAEDKENAKLVEELLLNRNLEFDIYDMLDAVGKGYSVLENVWAQSESQWWIERLEWKNPAWFKPDRIDGRTLRLRGDGGEMKDLTPYKYTIHEHRAKSGLPIRGGVVRPCAWAWLFKNFAVKDWVIFAEAYGQPIRLGKYHPGASPEDRAVLMRAIRNIGSDFGAIIPEGMDITFVESQGKTASTDMFERLARWCDEQMSKAVLGQTTTTDAISGGHAVSQEHNEVRGDIAKSDAKQVAATFNSQIVRPLIDLNKGPQKRYPTISIGRADSVDIDKESMVADRMARAGGRISRSGIVKRLGLPEAKDDNDVLTPLPPESSMALMSARSCPHGCNHDIEMASAAAPDAIDKLAEELASDYEDISPIVAALEQAARDAKDWDEFGKKLLDIAADVNLSKAAAEKIARAVMAARLAGNAGEKV